MNRSIRFLCVCCWMSAAGAAPLEFPAAATENAAALAKAAPILATQVIGLYQDNDRARFLDTLFKLQLVAGRYAEAAGALTELRALRMGDRSPGLAAKDLQYEIFLRAEALQATQTVTFAVAFARAFRKTLAPLDDATSAMLVRAMSNYSAGISLHAPIRSGACLRFHCPLMFGDSHLFWWGIVRGSMVH